MVCVSIWRNVFLSLVIDKGLLGFVWWMERYSCEGVPLFKLRIIPIIFSIDTSPIINYIENIKAIKLEYLR